MIDVFYIGQGDTLPAYTARVRDKNGPVSLSTVTAAYFTMARISTASVMVSARASIVETSVVDDNVGRVQYFWSVSDTVNTGDFAVAFVFVTAVGLFALPRNSMAKVVVEDRFGIGGS